MDADARSTTSTSSSGTTTDVPADLRDLLDPSAETETEVEVEAEVEAEPGAQEQAAAVAAGGPAATSPSSWQLAGASDLLRLPAGLPPVAPTHSSLRQPSGAHSNSKQHSQAMPSSLGHHQNDEPVVVASASQTIVAQASASNGSSATVIAVSSSTGLAFVRSNSLPLAETGNSASISSLGVPLTMSMTAEPAIYRQSSSEELADSQQQQQQIPLETFLSLPDVSLDRVYTYDDDILPHARRTYGPMPPGSSAGSIHRLHHRNSVQSQHIHTASSQSFFGTDRSTMDNSHVKHARSEQHLHAHTHVHHSTHPRIRILDALDESAVEVQALRRQVVGYGRTQSIIDKRLASVHDLSALREIYRLQRRSVREGYITASMQRFWQRVLWLFNLQHHWAVMARLVESESRLVLRAIFSMVIDLLMCIVYLVEMQANTATSDPFAGKQPTWLYISRPFWIFAFNFTCAILLLSPLIIEMILEDRRFKLMSVSIVIDLITSVPFLVLALIPNGTVIYVPYFLRSIMIVPRLESALHYGGQYRTFNVSAYKEKLAILATAITVIIYLGVCSFEFFENRFALSVAQGISEVSGLIQPMHVLYFVMITMSTVGYGDVTPKTIPGQVLVVIMILVAIIVLPGLINDVTENFRLQNSGGGAFTNDGRPFVVICGVFNTVGKVKDIAQAFLGADSDNRTRVVLLSRFKPNAAVRLFLKSPLYRRHFTILHGSGLDTDDLERVQLRHASAAFILADAAAPDPQMEDEHNTVRAWAFDDEAPHVQLYIDNLLPGTNILQEKTTTAGVCLQDLRQTFLALSCMYRGIGTLIINLLQSTNTYADYGDPWRIAYADGRSNQFCDMRLHSFFVGLSFTELALYLYEEFQMVLFGLQIFVEARGVHHVTLNPGASYRLGSDDLLLLIAPSRHDVSDLANLTKDQFDRTFVKAQLASRLNMCQRPQPNSSESSLSSISESRFAMYVKGYPTIAGSHSSVPQCYLLRYPAASKDMFVKDASHMSGHILVCTLSFDVARFVCTLRTTSLIAKDVKPILILSPKLPTKKDLAALAVFPEVYYAQGDARNRADLETIGNVRGADKVVVLKMRRQVDAHGSDQEDFSDSSSIMVSHLVYDMFHREGIRKFLIVELGRRTNIKFLRPTVKHDVAKRTLQRGNQPRAPPAEVAALLHDPYFTPVYAGGRVISSSMVEPILFQTFHTPCTIDVFHALCGERFKTDLELDELMDIAPAGLCQIAVPALAVDRPYAFLFQILATEYGVIPIGLLRESIDPAWGNKLPFVITNPVRSLLVKRDDLVFVIASPSNLA